MHPSDVSSYLGSGYHYYDLPYNMLVQVYYPTRKICLCVVVGNSLSSGLPFESSSGLQPATCKLRKSLCAMSLSVPFRSMGRGQQNRLSYDINLLLLIDIFYSLLVLCLKLKLL